MNNPEFDEDLPDFEFSTPEEAQEFVIKWAAERPQKFVATKGKREKNRVEVKCARSGKYVPKTVGIRNATSQKCGCPWKLSIKKTINADGATVWRRAYMNKWPTDGLYPGNDSHGGTHSLSTSVDQLQAIGSYREIDSSFEPIMRCLVAAKLRPIQIYDYLVKEYNKAGLKVTFTSKDIINRVSQFDESKQNLALDMTDVVKELERRSIENENTKYSILHGNDNDENPSTTGLFFLMKNGNSYWKSCGDQTVILYDTKHATNRYGWYLGIFSCVDSLGSTKILAVSLTKHQDIDTFSWVFKCFQNYYGDPKIIFTDEDAAMKTSIANVLMTTLHFLCIFHLWKNFYIHIMPLMKNGTKNDRKNVASAFWTLAKDSDSSMINEFDRYFSKMIETIVEIATNSSASDVSFLSNIYILSA